jgi:hypothetical protein
MKEKSSWHLDTELLHREWCIRHLAGLDSLKVVCCLVEELPGKIGHSRGIITGSGHLGSIFIGERR